MEKYIVALDQGTTSSRCIVFNKKGNICSMAQKELTQIYPRQGWVEQNPMEIWSTQYSVMTEAIAALGMTGEQIAGIGIPISERLQLCGTGILGNRFIMRLSGSVGALRK